ncbi:MAG: DUF3343 domain-containing protein [Clostridia bacterium]|nr:DUF3343 domain-containing protein [Clostridia bacterium]
MEYIFSFGSRNSAFRFADAVAAAGGKTRMVNAPIRTGSGCSLAVACADYSLCRDVLGRGHYAYLRTVYSFDGRDYTQIFDINPNNAYDA